MTTPIRPQRLEVTFRKVEGARFLSHLDLMATFEYAVRRAGLPVELSGGFNPRPRISVAAPLAVGHTGEREILEIGLREAMDAREAGQRLRAALPRGIEVTDAREVQTDGKPAAARLRAAEYRIDLPSARPRLQAEAATLLARDRVDVREERESGTRTRDIRPLLLELRADDTSLHMTLEMTAAGGLRPELVLDQLGIPAEGARVTRERLLLRGDTTDRAAGRMQ